MRMAGVGSVLWAVDSSLTVSNCWPVPYIYTSVCFVTEQLVRFWSPYSLGNRAVSLRPTLGVLRDLPDARKSGKYSWYQSCALRLQG